MLSLLLHAGKIEVEMGLHKKKFVREIERKGEKSAICTFSYLSLLRCEFVHICRCILRKIDREKGGRESLLVSLSMSKGLS